MRFSTDVEIMQNDKSHLSTENDFDDLEDEHMELIKQIIDIVDNDELTTEAKNLQIKMIIDKQDNKLSTYQKRQLM